MVLQDHQSKNLGGPEDVAVFFGGFFNSHLCFTVFFLDFFLIFL